MAWTYGLCFAGVDFTFAIDWFTDRWHEKLWWLIAIAATVQVLLPVPLLVEAARRFRPDAVPAAGALALLRFTAVMCFAVAWIAASGREAGGLRLAAVLQDGFCWLLLGGAAVGCYRAGAYGQTPSPPVLSTPSVAP
jgi:hypothetical protein